MAEQDSEHAATFWREAEQFQLSNPAPRAKPLDFTADRQRQGKLLSLKGEPDQTTMFAVDGFEPE